MEHVPTQYSTTINKVIKKDPKQPIFIANEKSRKLFHVSKCCSMSKINETYYLKKKGFNLWGYKEN